VLNAHVVCKALFEFTDFGAEDILAVIEDGGDTSV
jgi:hypothetical protein